MEYAVIQSGGKQYKVSPGDVVTVDKVGGESSITIEDVLLYSKDGKVEVGTPFVGAHVIGEVIKNYQGEKIRIGRFKAKSNYRRVVGFRAQLTDIKISKIELISKKSTAKEAASE